MVRIIDKSKEDYSWDFISPSILKIAKKDWKKAIRMKEKDPYLRDYHLNERLRGKLAEFMLNNLKLSKKSNVLDIGSGTGSLTIALARKFNTFSADTSSSTLKFVKYRAEQEGVNLKLYKIDPLHKKLPFKNSSFDVIVMNGVLEWVALATKGKVKEIQEKVLKEMYRILKKGGIFILSIENRLALDWLMGKKKPCRI